MTQRGTGLSDFTVTVPLRTGIVSPVAPADYSLWLHESTAGRSSGAHVTAAAQHPAAARLIPRATGLRFVSPDTGKLRAAGRVSLVVGAGPVAGAGHVIRDLLHVVRTGEVRPGRGERDRVCAASRILRALSTGSAGLRDLVLADASKAVFGLAGLIRRVRACRPAGAGCTGSTGPVRQRAAEDGRAPTAGRILPFLQRRVIRIGSAGDLGAADAANDVVILVVSRIRAGHLWLLYLCTALANFRALAATYSLPPYLLCRSALVIDTAVAGTSPLLTA